ncbi:lipoprotein signal peptidase [Mangrovimonas yunxiaonensis]|uniref:Lipoprotein signal peptidase n=1 Tax=Mangrovimonas yunxiaonensis TaxID=1197477 RepID=A0A084TM76_9FLAO|nr:signal peptidase II [Mangrovimonas yunxiaonensis]KFB01812.1 lipoprotein signal peptidase [Mangrovimonas yunxiaonensis]MBR9757438.1 signal peptidase II [Algicola sp.]GGH41126.1 lipoprotein signal peptidase [Mangrovimonas yunxiaonensis]
MKLSRSVFIIGLIVFNIAIDQISKVIVRATVTPYQESDIIGKYLILTNVENRGAFLGMGSDMNPTLRLIFLLLLPIVVLGYVVYYIFKHKTLDKASLVGFCCIVGGGIANVFDRIVFGSVTDFLHIDLGGVFRTGIFNVADMSVMLGLGLLLYANFKYKNAPESN